MPLISPPLARPNCGPYTSIWVMNRNTCVAGHRPTFARMQHTFVQCVTYFILVPCNHLLKQSESSPMHSKILQQKVLLAAPLETAFSHIATGNYFTRSGKSCSMTNSLKHIITGLSASVMMGWIVDFIPAYLPTQPIIPKSESTYFHIGSETDLDYTESS